MTIQAGTCSDQAIVNGFSCRTEVDLLAFFPDLISVLDFELSEQQQMMT